VVTAAGSDAHLGELRAALGTPELDAPLLELALTHRSYAYEHGGLPTNERLEFLGDAVLGLVVTEALFRRHHGLPEGRARKAASRGGQLACPRLGRPRPRSRPPSSSRPWRAFLRRPGQVLDPGRHARGADRAVYLDSGFAGAAILVHRLFDPLLDSVVDLGAGLDWKSSLQELAAEHQLGAPEYLLDESGPDHAKSFTARVRMAADIHGHGSGRSKKEAEQRAAQSAWLALSEQHVGTSAAQAAQAGSHPTAQPD
jgi:ribonuclease-3